MIDITIDFETCALCPTAAVMSVAAVAWNRDCADTPFYTYEGKQDADYVYMRHVDLRSQFIDGFTFDQATADWWATRDKSAKAALLDNDDLLPIAPISEVIGDLFAWMKELAAGKQIILWSQGTDFDIAILRNICYKYGISIPVNHKNFRDHRTFYLEGARMILDRAGEEFDANKAYALVEPYEGDGAAHDPIFDCKQSIYSTWQMMKHLKCLNSLPTK